MRAASGFELNFLHPLVPENATAIHPITLTCLWLQGLVKGEGSLDSRKRVV